MLNVKANDRVVYWNGSEYIPCRLVLNGAYLTNDGLFFCLEEISTSMVTTRPADQIIFECNEITEYDRACLMETGQFISKLALNEISAETGYGRMSDGEWLYNEAPTDIEKISGQYKAFQYVCWYDTTPKTNKKKGK